MKNNIEGFKNEIDLKTFENRLAEINLTCFLGWKVGVNLAFRVSDVLKITVNQVKNYAVDKKTGKVNHVKINENTSIALKEALELRKKAIVSKENPFLFVGEWNRTSKSKKYLTR